MFVPLFKELLPSIGTKNYKAAEFNDRLMSCSNGIEVSIDRFSRSDDINNSEEQILI
jgi:Zn-dependent M16 (insulinase) family peptidase